MLQFDVLAQKTAFAILQMCLGMTLSHIWQAASRDHGLVIYSLVNDDACGSAFTAGARWLPV